MSLFGGGTTTTSSTGTQSTQVAPAWSTERNLNRASFDNATQLAQGMNPQERQALMQQMFSALFDPAAAGIRQSYETLGNQQYQQSASRGFAGSSKQEGQDIKRTSMEARDIGDAKQQAQLGAFQASMAEQENRRMQMMALLGNINQMYNQRLARSNITTTGSQSMTQPANVFGTIGQAAGLAVGAGWNPLASTPAPTT